MNNDKIFIIAEAGVNHNGSLETAKQLIDAAVATGVDAIKFQTFKTENLVANSTPKAVYQLKNTANQLETQFEMLKKLELDSSAHRILIDYCQSKGIIFLSSPFDLESIDELINLGLCIFKIPSGEIENLPYLRKIGRLNKKIILSTGMSFLADVEQALYELINAGTDKNNITILHCNTEYPTPMRDVNLNAMLTLQSAFKVSVGYSDHTVGIEAAIAAAALGASVIEKHFTLNKNQEGPDHQASLDPDELKQMVNSIRNIELALGNGIKKPSISEENNIAAARKSIIASKTIKKGEIFSELNLTIKRPGNGISPKQWDTLLGQVAQRDYMEDEMI